MAINRKSDRRTSATNALVLFVAGAIILVLLVRWSDNAYIGLGFLGLVLVASAVPFLIAIALPRGTFRRVAFFFGILLVWAFALLGTVYLVNSIAGIRAIPSYGSSVLVNHLLALPLVLVTAYLVGYRSWRKRGKGAPRSNVRSEKGSSE